MYCVIHQIEIYPVENVAHPSNNQSLILGVNNNNNNNKKKKKKKNKKKKNTQWKSFLGLVNVHLFFTPWVTGYGFCPVLPD